MNLTKLNQQLYYHPHWQQDKIVFNQLLKKSQFKNKDIILFARLYVKYSHLHCFKSNELNEYFDYILKKMKIYSSSILFYKTREIYNQTTINYD